MFVKFVLATACVVAGAALIPTAQAETLATPHTKRPARHHSSVVAGTVPTRGMTMAQVERRFGAPVNKLPAAGGDTPRHPVIHRWRYNGYTVYFERSHVIHSVMDSVAPAPKA